MTDTDTSSNPPLSIISPFEKMAVQRFLSGGPKTQTVQTLQKRAKSSISKLKEEMTLLEKLASSK